MYSTRKFLRKRFTPGHGVATHNTSIEDRSKLVLQKSMRSTVNEMLQGMTVQYILQLSGHKIYNVLHKSKLSTKAK